MVDGGVLQCGEQEESDAQLGRQHDRRQKRLAVRTAANVEKGDAASDDHSKSALRRGVIAEERDHRAEEEALEGLHGLPIPVRLPVFSEDGSVRRQRVRFVQTLAMNPDGDESRDGETADKEGGRRDRQRTELGVHAFLAEEGWIDHETQPLRSGREIVLTVVGAPKVADHHGGDGGVQNHEERDRAHHAAALVPEQPHARARREF